MSPPSRMAWPTPGQAIRWTLVAAFVLGALARSVDPVAALVPATLWAVAAVGLGLLLGRANQPLLCQAAFMATGAYTYAWATSPTPSGRGWPTLVGLVLAAGLTAAIAAITSPVLRVRGYPFALATIALGLLIQQGMRTGDWLPGANTGLFAVPDLAIGPLTLDEPADYLIASTVLLVALGLAGHRLLDAGRRARELSLIAQDEQLAATVGIDPFKLKRRLLVAGAVLGAVAGALFAASNGIVQPTTFDLQDSFLLAVAVMVGGRRTTSGAVAGALVFTLLGQALGSDNAELRTGLLGALLIATMRVAPDGLLARTPRPSSPDHEAGGASTRSPLDPSLLVAPEAGGASLDVHDLCVDYDGVRALDGCSLAVAGGELVTVIGPNGAGKSTLLGALSGAARASGTVRIGEYDVSRRSAHRRARIGLARTHQAVALDDTATVAENVAAGVDLAARVHQRSWSESERQERARRALSAVGLEGRGEERADRLSPADARFAELARLVASEPRVALLDEPVAGLDAAERRDVAALIGELNRRGCTVVVVEHDLAFVRHLGGRTIALVEGRVAVEGPPAEVFADEALRTAYLGQEQPA